MYNKLSGVNELNLRGLLNAGGARGGGRALAAPPHSPAPPAHPAHPAHPQHPQHNAQMAMHHAYHQSEYRPPLPFFTFIDPHGPSQQRVLRWGGVSKSDRLLPYGVPLCA